MDDVNEDADDLMEDTVGMLLNIGVTSAKTHEEANTLRKVLLTCGGDKAVVRSKGIEVYSPPRVTVEARRRLDLNVEGGCRSTLKQTRMSKYWISQ